MREEDWRTEEQKEADLRIENAGLEREIELQGGLLSKGKELDPEIHNAFLQNVLAFEEASKGDPVSLQTLFPDGYVFAPVKSMSPEELHRKIGEIEDILAMHNVFFGFRDGIPDSVLYEHLVTDCIPNSTIEPVMSAGFSTVLDGCGGGCEECFQKDYCETAKEMLDEGPDSKE